MKPRFALKPEGWGGRRRRGGRRRVPASRVSRRSPQLDLPILIGDGIPFFEKRDGDISIHLAEVNAYTSGIVELRYEVRRGGKDSG